MGDYSDMLYEGYLCTGCGINLEMEYADWDAPGHPVFCPNCNPEDFGEACNEFNQPLHLKMINP